MDVAAFGAGFGIGAVLGALVLGPAVRAGLARSEYRRASREAELTDELLRRMADATGEPAAPRPHP